MTVTFFSNLQTGSALSHPIIIKGVREEDYILIKAEVVNDSEIFIGCLVETIQTNGTDVDRYYATYTAAESKTNLGIVPDTPWNLKILESGNAAEATKALTFSDGDVIEVAVPVGGVIAGAVLAAAQGTVLPGKRLVAAGAGTLKVHPDDITVDTHTTGTTVTTTTSGIGIDPTIAIMLCRATTSSGTQWIVVKLIGG